MTNMEGVRGCTGWGVVGRVYLLMYAPLEGRGAGCRGWWGYGVIGASGVSSCRGVVDGAGVALTYSRALPGGQGCGLSRSDRRRGCM